MTVREYLNDQKLKALNWKQPYATLMLEGKIETRVWATKYRGPVLICASALPYGIESLTRISGRELGNILEKMEKYYEARNVPQGYAMAIGRLVDCRPMVKEDEAKSFVEYHPELLCHIYEDVKPIVPIPWKGTQGWRDVSDEVINLLNFADHGDNT